MSQIGMNLSSVNYWSTESPFIDRFKTSGTWYGATADYKRTTGAVPLDANGNPTGMPAGAADISVQVGVDYLASPGTDRYVLTYSGSGTIKITGGKIVSTKGGEIVFDFTDPTNDFVTVTITGMSAANPPKDFHLVRQDQVGLFQSGEIFNPAFTAKASQWDTLRFMDWEATNTLAPVTWANRTQVSNASWASGTSASGVPLEVMVKLANETHTDMWFNIPTEADDTYVRNAMTYIRDNLDPSLKVKVEYSNEVWNWGFAAAKWAQAQADTLWGKNTAGGWMTYYGYRSAQVASIANSVFGASGDARLETIISTQTGNLGLESYAIDGVARAKLGSVSSLFDDYAVTTYFGNALSVPNGNAADQKIVLGWARSGEAGMAAAFKELESGGALSVNDSLANLTKVLASEAQFAANNGLKLVAYEGGASLTSSSFAAADQADITSFIGRLMNDPRMGALYTKMVAAFDAAGGDLLTAFADAGGNSKYGYWGVLDDIYQTGSSRYDALAASAKAGASSALTADVRTASASYTLTPSGRTLTYTGAGLFSGTGNSAANTMRSGDGGSTLYGLAGNDMLVGGAGNDYLDGGTGSDTMIGGGGNDTYIVDSTGDVVVEASGAGTDEIRTTLGSYALPANVENLVYTGTNSFSGTGNELNNVITGGSGPNKLYGGDGDDVLYGGASNDLLDGGAGNDIMAGGLGNDIYIVDSKGDVVTELADQGTDEVRTSLADYTLGANVENLTYTGVGAFTGTGNDLANVITAGNGGSVLSGGGGNDTLVGGSGNDYLDGGVGADRMTGGAGNDTYVVDNPGDTVVEGVNGGTDTVRTTLSSYNLGANVENLTFVGAGSFSGSGNALDNVLTGGAGINRLYGGDGKDVLIGGVMGDTLDGGTGADVMSGGLGDDTYYVDNPGDVVLENPNEGNDTVYSSITYTLGANVENLRLSGTAAIDGSGNASANTIYGNAGANRLFGYGGNDSIAGGDGNDVIDGGSGDDWLSGDAGDDVIYGGAGSDQLFGGAGNDTLYGGGGRDILYGGSGADRFVFAPGDLGATPADADIIYDFSHAEGDKIDLSAYDAIATTAKDDAFTFVGTAAFSKRAGELRSYASGNYWLVQGDLNGDGVADFSLLVNKGASALVANDFIL